MSRWRWGEAIALILFVTSVSGTVHAQTYPTRPVTVVVPYPTGAGADMVARLTVDALASDLGQPFIIDNRPGAAGTTGTASVARAAPDGYTLLMTVNPPIVLNKFLQKSVPYDPLTALAPITLTAESPILVVVHPSLPVKSISELVDHAKKNPMKISYGSPGIGTGQHIVGELLNRRAGIEMIHVPYRGTAQQMQDVVSGVIQVGLGTPSAVLSLANAGAVRIIAVAEAKRFEDIPDVPTISETIPGISFNTWYGMFAPANTPKAIVDRLNQSMVKHLKDPDTVRKLRLQGIVATGGSPEQLGELVRSELIRYAAEIPMIGIAPQ